jgi:hypothetical protein
VKNLLQLHCLGCRCLDLYRTVIINCTVSTLSFRCACLVYVREILPMALQFMDLQFMALQFSGPHPLWSYCLMWNTEAVQGSTMSSLINEIGWAKLFTNGLPLRIVMVGTLTGLQWGIYDAYKASTCNLHLCLVLLTLHVKRIASWLVSDLTSANFYSNVQVFTWAALQCC